jgi:hypothetical protein
MEPQASWCTMPQLAVPKFSDEQTAVIAQAQKTVRLLNLATDQHSSCGKEERMNWL